MTSAVYDWIEHADGVYSKRYRSLDLNIGAVVCEDGLLVIDTRAHHAQARELKSDLRRISRLPVRWVVNTHHHWDHAFGNGEFASAAIWGHVRCAEVLRARGDAMREQVKEQAPEHAAAFDEVAITPPVHTLADEATVTFGGRRLHLTHPGRAHTDNDLLVRVVDSGVVFAGDLIEEGAPPSFGDAFPLEWPGSLDATLGHMGGPVVPGHGAIVDAAFAEGQRDELAELAALARERHAEGMTSDEAAAAGGPYGQDHRAIAFERAWRQLEEETR